MLRIASISLLLALSAHAMEGIEGYKDFKFGQSIDDIERELSNRKVGYTVGAQSSASGDIPILLDTLEKVKSKITRIDLSKFRIRMGDSGTGDFARFALCNSDYSKYEMMSIGYPVIDSDSIRFVVDTVNSVRYVFIKKKLRFITKLNPEKHSFKKVSGILEVKYGAPKFENNRCINRAPNGNINFAYNIIFNQPSGQARMIVLSDYQQDNSGAINHANLYDSTELSIIPTGLTMGMTNVVGVSYIDPLLIEEMAKQWQSIISDYLEIKNEIRIRKDQMESEEY